MPPKGSPPFGKREDGRDFGEGLFKTLNSYKLFKSLNDQIK